ncbi:MAG TPA: hypothetical protein VF522_00505 [Ramlibacter sp.]|uniref:hypothetical protein n=1 Tax=Ramlibacter sp. TaxID=1917967 RepID=UPI002ED3B125
MGNWSEYYQDVPEEKAANYVNRRFDPQAAEALRARNQRVLQPALGQDGIRTIAQQHRPKDRR